MKQAMKHRLVGAIVLACLAIIFLPILLDGEGIRRDGLDGSNGFAGSDREPQGLTSRIPATPPVPPVPDARPRRPEILADSEAGAIPAPAEEARQAREEAPAAGEGTAADQPSLDERGLPRAWSVRLASFAEAGNASGLVDRLLAADYKGYSRPVTSSQGTLTAVYVGPVLSRGEADDLREGLEEEFQLNGLVVRYSAEQGRN